MRYFPALLLTAYAAFGQSPYPDASRLIPDLMKRANVPGLSMAVIENGKIAKIGSYGVKNADTSAKVDDRTVFQAASLSKVVFAYSVLKLVDEGKLDLDTPLSKYLPNYVDDPRVNAITARFVLTHRTGFPNWRPDDRSLEIRFTPGERFSYSGEGFVYLQRAVAKITGVPLEDWMRKTVFDPLGMNDSSYTWQDKFERMASNGHRPVGRPDPFMKPTADGNPVNGPGASAASSLLTTAHDYATFLIALMSGNGLKPETARAMLSPQTKVDASCANCTGKPVTEPSKTINWGLGVGLQKIDGQEYFWHWGDNGDFKAFFSASTDSRRGVVVFTNSANGMMIIPDIAAQVLGEPQPAFAWVHYERWDSPRMQLYQAILDNGIDEALKNNWSELDEGDLNMLGYSLIGAKKYREAIRIFELNATAHPKSGNAFDSLGEAYMIAGKALAIENYKKSLALDPDNSNASEMIKKLEAK